MSGTIRTAGVLLGHDRREGPPGRRKHHSQRYHAGGNRHARQEVTLWERSEGQDGGHLSMPCHRLDGGNVRLLICWAVGWLIVSRRLLVAFRWFSVLQLVAWR